MKTVGWIVLFLMLLMAGLVIVEVQAYPIADMVLRDANGVPIVPGSNTPYSPKQTCGSVACHIDMVRSFGLTSGTVYESEPASAVKDHGPGTTPYQVPYPMHGVSAGYHFQTGRNASWSQTQRDYYQVPDFTSSPSLYGGSCPSSGRQLSDLNALISVFDLSSYEFGHSECTWCHSGGGPLEYDRQGYRYDGAPGLFKAGANPSPPTGDYYRYDPATNSIVDSTAAWQSGGVAEVDCLLCHMNTSADMRYSLLERNYALSEAKTPVLAASLGLVGSPTTTGWLEIARKAQDGVNPDIDPAGWVWQNNVLDHGVIVSPPKENCAVCHVADKGLTRKGPAGIALGLTAFQKLLPAGSVPDGDRVGGGSNEIDWKIVKARADSEKRAASINDPGNPDAHMDRSMNCAGCHYTLGSSRDYASDCVYCHYGMWGYPAPPEITPVAAQVFPALTSSNGTEVLPPVGVFKIDHQFAKGYNGADGMDMDQLDNTVSCENCHITRTHPNAGSAPDPSAAHSGFPALHFGKIGCRTCHIPEVNGTRKQVAADHAAGPYQGTDREQLIENPAGVHYKPLHQFRPDNHLGSGHKIEPITTLASFEWVSGGTFQPVLQRIATQAAEGRRAASGDADGDGFFDWPLNRPQAGDTALIVNTTAEIADMASRLQAAGIPDPVLNVVLGKIDLSHNVAPRSSGKILGSAAGGGCLMCHSSGDPSLPNYTPLSYGFFDQTHVLFNNPVETDGACGGAAGVMQTTINGTRRVRMQFTGLKTTGAAFALDLADVPDCTPVRNTVGQGEVMGYSASDISSLTNPGTAGVLKPQAYFSWVRSAAVNYRIDFDATGSTCTNAPCDYTWSLGDGTNALGTTVSHTYAAAGSYPVALMITDSYGFRSQTLQTVTAQTVNQPPTAAGLSSATINNYTVSFTDASTDPASNSPNGITVNTVAWGDGGSSSGAVGSVFTHTYTLARSYTITHSVTDAAGLSASEKLTVTVPQKFSIAGTVTHGTPATPLSGVTMILKLNGTTKATTTTAADGTYSFANQSPATYTVQPYKSGTVFTPATRTVTIGPNATGIDFTGTP